MKKLLSIFFIFFTILISSRLKVNAGTDLNVTCNPNTACTIDQVNTSLFNEMNVYPGYSVSQKLNIDNISTDQNCALYLDVTNTSPTVSPNLATRIFTAIKDNSHVYYGEIVNGEVSSDSLTTKTLQNLYDQPQFYINTISPSSSLSLDWLAFVDREIGNSFEDTHTIFDFELSFTCDTDPIPTPTNSSENNDDGGDSEGSSSDSDSGCTAVVPNFAPILVAEHTGQNQVTLNWWPVSPVTHYALVFTRVSDGASYGSTNIGDVTHYVVNDLQVGETYQFQVFGINDCAPGKRSNTEEVTIATGTEVSVDQRPVGEDGQVLGDEDHSLTPTPTPSTEISGTGTTSDQTDGSTGSVAGASNSCSIGKIYLPIILLLIQAISMIVVEYVYRAEGINPKAWWLVSLLGLTNIIFYLLRQCQCNTEGSVLSFLCRWFILVSIVLGLLIRFTAFAFMEEIETSKE